MSKIFPTKIKMEYTPSLNIEKVKKVLKINFPEYDQVWPFLFAADNGIALKKRPWALAAVRLKHKPRRNQTIISIFLSYTPASAFYGGPMLGLFTIGDLLEDVELVIRREIPNMITD